MKIAFPVVFALFWTAIVGTFDAMIGLNFYRALQAQSFATTTGTITHSEVAEHPGEDGPTFGVDIRYDYHVQGQKFSGANYRYTAGSSSDSDWAYEAVGVYKVGAIVPIHYDADNPAESVLQPGIDPGDLFLLLFMTPFNLVMAATWWYGGALGWHWWNGTKPNPVHAFHDSGKLHLRVTDAPPVLAGFVAIGFAAFLSIFVVAFTAGFHPNMNFILAVWALVIAAGLAAGTWVWRKQSEGAYDVLIGDRTVELPATYERAQRETVERRSISGVKVTKISAKDSESSDTYAVSLTRIAGEDAKVAEWYDEKSAHDLAAWLQQQLGLPHAG